MSNLKNVKKTLILSLIFLFTNILYSQVSEDLLVNLHSVSDTEMNSLIPNPGSLVFNTDFNTVYVYDGTIWKKLNNNLEITYETVALSAGNQVLNVRDADKIIGYTLISNLNSLRPSSGKMSGTWFINDDRDVIRAYIQTLEHPFIKSLVISVQINNTANTITFSNYTSRFWRYTDNVPQTNLSNSGTNYRLGKIVIIRKE